MVTNLVVTKKRGFDIASLVKEDSNVDGNDSSYINDNNKRSKNDTQLSGSDHQTDITSGSSAFHRPKSPALNRKSSALSTSMPTTLSSNSMTNSAFKKVDQKCNLMENAYDFSSFYQRLSASAMIPHVARNASPMIPAMSLSASLSSSIPNKSFVSNTLLPYLPPSLAALTFPTSNWCAKCNATFRMTSDLVYHMRSHHKNVTAVDPMKKKREEKLKCNICHETFRERHHLTRHMTSHQ